MNKTTPIGTRTFWTCNPLGRVPPPINSPIGSGNDAIFGGDGDDLINSDGGNDTVIGGDGADTMLGGAGNDLLLGRDGADYIDGQAGIDTIAGNEGADTLIAEPGEIDELFALTSIDRRLLALLGLKP